MVPSTCVLGVSCRVCVTTSEEEEGHGFLGKMDFVAVSVRGLLVCYPEINRISAIPQSSFMRFSSSEKYLLNECSV